MIISLPGLRKHIFMPNFLKYSPFTSIFNIIQKICRGSFFKRKAHCHGVPKNQGEIWRRGEKLFKVMSEDFKFSRPFVWKGGRKGTLILSLLKMVLENGNGCAFLTDCLPTRESHQKWIFHQIFQCFKHCKLPACSFSCLRIDFNFTGLLIFQFSSFKPFYLVKISTRKWDLFSLAHSIVSTFFISNLNAHMDLWC